MKIVSIVGARPQFIKASVVSRGIREKFKEILCHTGQHYDYEMSKVFFDQLRIPEPEYNLGVGSEYQGEQTGKMLTEIEKVLLKEKPDFVLVYGDTNSTIAGALAAVKMHIPVGHVEAGLRSFDKSMPEEINRILTDHSSDFLFAPTQTAVNNLKREDITKGVYLTGDVMYDVLLNNLKIAEKSDILKKIGIKPGKYLLTTIHRQSNADNKENLSNILEALSETDKKFVFPIHPRTEKMINQYKLKNKIGKNIIITKPVGYFDFLWLQKNSLKILTDSGGIQKEAYLLKIPCITLRENTEWVETINDGWNILVGSNKKRILNAINNFKPTHIQKKVFGDGNASKKIIKILTKDLGAK
jgi:UDP-N-acetylglucosamine 2-epimerase (non-hydrolysing)